MKNNVLWRRRTVLGLIAALVAWGLFQGFRPQAGLGEALQRGLAARGGATPVFHHEAFSMR